MPSAGVPHRQLASIVSNAESLSMSPKSPLMIRWPVSRKTSPVKLFPVEFEPASVIRVPGIDSMAMSPSPVIVPS
jgi:hypothetical protein